MPKPISGSTKESYLLSNNLFSKRNLFCGQKATNDSGIGLNAFS